jgi:hypothetical protein
MVNRMLPSTSHLQIGTAIYWTLATCLVMIATAGCQKSQESSGADPVLRESTGPVAFESPLPSLARGQRPTVSAATILSDPPENRAPRTDPLLQGAVNYWVDATAQQMSDPRKSDILFIEAGHRVREVVDDARWDSSRSDAWLAAEVLFQQAIVFARTKHPLDAIDALSQSAHLGFSDPDRFRELAAYLEADPRISEQLAELAGLVQAHCDTLAQRGRWRITRRKQSQTVGIELDGKRLPPPDKYRLIVQLNNWSPESSKQFQSIYAASDRLKELGIEPIGMVTRATHIAKDHTNPIELQWIQSPKFVLTNLAPDSNASLVAQLWYPTCLLVDQKERLQAIFHEIISIDTLIATVQLLQPNQVPPELQSRAAGQSDPESSQKPAPEATHPSTVLQSSTRP